VQICVPRFHTMFSTLGRYRRFDIRLETTDPVPQWISREWRSAEWRAKDAVRRAQNAYATCMLPTRFLSSTCACLKKCHLNNFNKLEPISIALAGHHCEYLLYTSSDFRRDLTGSSQSHSQISEEDKIQNRSDFVANVFSGSVAT